MGSQRDAFGNLNPLDGEITSSKCVVRGCPDPVRHQRSSQTTSYGLCDRHVADWDAGRVVGSLIVGYHVKVG